jgi:hypothetical protein
VKPWTWFVAVIFIGVTGCAKQPQPVAPSAVAVPSPTGMATTVRVTQPVVTKTPRINAEISKVPTELPAKPNPTIVCSDGLTFVSDLTVPDGTRIGRGATVDKRWQVKNSGTCNWGEGYQLVLIAGPDLGQPAKQALIPARAGAQAMIRLLIVAPVTPGSYTSAWQAYSPAGEPFGEVIYVQFQVN